MLEQSIRTFHNILVPLAQSWGYRVSHRAHSQQQLLLPDTASCWQLSRLLKFVLTNNPFPEIPMSLSSTTQVLPHGHDIFRDVGL